MNIKESMERLRHLLAQATDKQVFEAVPVFEGLRDMNPAAYRKVRPLLDERLRQALARN